MSDTQGTWKGSAPFGTGWNADVVEAVGSDLEINNGTIDVTAITADTLWGNPQTIAAKPTPVAIGPGLTLPATGTLAAQWQTGTVVSKVGSDLSVNSGTIDIAAITAASLYGNPGTAAAKPSAIAVGSGLTLSAAGTLSNTGILSLVGGTNVTISGGNTISATGGGGSGTVTQVVAGAGLAGGTITTAGTISAQWQGGTVTAIGPEFVEPSGTLHFDQMATYISASATIDTTYFGKNLVDNSTGASDIVLTLTTLAAATHLTFNLQNNSAHHYVRLRPGTGVTINGVASSDYLLPNFTGGAVSIDSTGTAYTTGAALSFWNPSAGYVTALNGLKITNDGTFSTNGTLTPVVDGTSIVLSGGTLSATAGAAITTLVAGPASASSSTVGMAVPVINAPGAATFSTWINQNSATIGDSTNGPTTVQSTQTTVGDSLSLRMASVPAGSWTLTINATTWGHAANGSGNPIPLALSDGTKIYVIGVFQSSGIFINHWTNSTTFSAQDLASLTAQLPNPCWYRVIYDSVTPKLTFQWSADGFNFATLFSTTTLFLTPSLAGVGVDTKGNISGVAMGVSINYWHLA